MTRTRLIQAVGLILAVMVLQGCAGVRLERGQADEFDPATAVGRCIEDPGTPGEQLRDFTPRPIPCPAGPGHPHLRVTEVLPASAAYNAGDPLTGRPGGPNCDPPADRYAVVFPPGGREFVLCLEARP